jgi:hypothetical protein
MKRISTLWYHIICTVKIICRNLKNPISNWVCRHLYHYILQDTVIFFYYVSIFPSIGMESTSNDQELIHCCKLKRIKKINIAIFASISDIIVCSRGSLNGGRTNIYTDDLWWQPLYFCKFFFTEHSFISFFQ